MIYQTIEADTKEEALKKAKKEYGSDIIINDWKKIGSFFKKKKYQLHFSIEDAKYARYISIKHAQMAINKSNSVSVHATKTVQNIVNDKNQKQSVDTNALLMKKLEQIENELRNQKQPEKNVNPNIQYIKEILKENEFFDDFINEVVTAITKELPYDDVNNLQKVKTFVYNYISEKLTFTQIPESSELDKSIIALIGPTGVGKSTTVAKLAGQIIRHNSGVTENLIQLITIDGYKLGAKEQMQTYSKLMNISFDAVDDNDKLNRLIATSRSKYVLIDTIGRSQGDERNILEMKSLLSTKFPVKFFLVISATTKQKEVSRIFESFKHYFQDIVGVIITKQDESPTIGAIINEAINNKLSIAYITNGQRVPTNILQATTETVMSTINGLPAIVAMEIEG